uniref:Uncharacterized protein n=1 Tax=Glossina palpalis gambiensis TaxID=67801 RepID=A0A1B0AVN5_9MUSC
MPVVPTIRRYPAIWCMHFNDNSGGNNAVVLSSLRHTTESIVRICKGLCFNAILHCIDSFVSRVNLLTLPSR